jgi:uncharacterized membrane protein
MKKDEHHDISRDEIKKEFQLERMTLFSDAVFAIVITLMAIEIRLPEGAISADELPEKLLHILPTLIAYSVSYLFIGVVWYQHLKMFSILKDYDKGLVIRNLALLFFVGLFPFCASVLTKAGGTIQSVFIYTGVILLSITAQYFLYYYIIVQRPELRIQSNIEEHKSELQKKKISLIIFSTLVILIFVTYTLISNPEQKNSAILWICLFPLAYRLMSKRKQVK